MSLADVQRILRVPGRFVVAPTTSLAGAFPYGGSFLGFHHGAHLVPEVVYRDVWAMEWGRKVVKLYAREIVRLGAIVRGCDPVAYALFFPTTAQASGELYAYGQARCGTLVTDVKLLFAPRDVSAPGVLFQRALPEVDRAARVNLQLNEDAEKAVIFDVGAVAVGGTPPWQIGLLSELTL